MDVGFNAAQTRLTNLTRGGLLHRASHDAYQELGTGLARIGPLGAVPGLSRLVTVRFTDLSVREDSAVGAIRWEAAGPTGRLFPALDADIKLIPAGPDTTVLAVSGSYRPPLGSLGAGADRAIMRRVAQATIRAFTDHIAAAIVHPAAAPAAGRTDTTPELISRPEPSDP